MEDSTDVLFLVEIQDNAREAGQRLRASYNAMRSKGMLDKHTYRELETNLLLRYEFTER
jgi:hypothetical protein